MGVYALATVVAAIIDVNTLSFQLSGTPTFTLLLLLVGVVPAYAVAFRRLHDRDLSGWIIGGQWLLNAVWFMIDHFRTITRGSIIDLPFMLINGVDLLLTFGLAGFLLYQVLQPGQLESNQYGPPPAESIKLARDPLGRDGAPLATSQMNGRKDPIEMIERLARLHDQGLLNAAEFNEQKAVLLAEMAFPAEASAPINESGE